MNRMSLCCGLGSALGGVRERGRCCHRDRQTTEVLSNLWD